ncbi:carbon-nitrogen hydrolase family protein [Alteromonas sp. a30]|uniref:carbon-nitrogen hydrolase family protein n=1 Tax=Alteromonas sp. a30 TaxID=2730917 RepID=UPI0022821F68|nr:carbon-nitrogen hydrolase family protein [Alteromonas sp. a30]MCY7295255.1 carbon-nitrogen hydrolase family protein [Alteromonas sp. a30]
MPNLIALQMVSVPDAKQNLDQVESLIKALKPKTPALVVLPECFAFFGAKDKDQLNIAEAMGTGMIQDRLSSIAKQYGVWLVSGTMPTKIETESERFQASCLVFDDEGVCRADYQKIHLFDVQVADNTGSYLESRTTKPGEKITVIDDTPFGRLGVAVCYDIRFPGLFQAMGQIDVLALPAAFTEKTGAAHWHPLLQARSIEKQCYVVAANQGGEHQNGRMTYGHSCIYSGWGELLTEIRKGPGCVSAVMDFKQLTEIRNNMPITQHNRFRSELV